ncbi:MAG: MSMEG_1061 family FMN-dependent PPOX-type flavoprotein [Pseudomonadota bacterium]
MYKAKDVVTNMAEVRGVIDGIQPPQVTKIIDHVDAHCRAWIAASPFLVMATYDASGRVDVSPKGDPAGFVAVLDDNTLAVPDRPGNHRFDGFENILQTGRIGLVFFVPNRNEVVRVNGSARVVRDADIRARLAIKDRVPEFAVLVDVEEAFFHCGKAVIRSGLWRPEDAGPTEGLPTYAEALKDQSGTDQSLKDVAARLRFNEEKRLYDE